MKKQIKIAITATIFIALAAFLHTARTHAEETAAIDAATRWLQIVDAGQYDQSWEAAAKNFKRAVSKDQWRQSLSAFRYPMGNVLKRKISLVKSAETLPGAPDGKYVTVTYATAFTNKKTAIETVTPMLDSDGKWRVAGYYIK